MIQQKVINGFDTYNLYQYWFTYIMFNPRYKYVNNTLLKRYVVKKYLKTLRLKG